MDYTLHQLRVFLKVVQLKSITKAARELGLTQPAVSMQLKKFQEQFTIPLTEIVGRRLYVTDFGKEIALASENILSEVAIMHYKTLAYQGSVAGRLNIAAASTAKYVAPYFLSEFVSSNPGINLTLGITNKGKVLESLASNEVDFAMVPFVPERMNVEHLSLLKNRLYLVAGKPVISQLSKDLAEMFVKFPVLFRERGSSTRFLFDEFISRHNLTIHKKMELSSNEALKQSVIAGLGIAIMPLVGMKNELQNGDLSIIPYPDLPLENTWNLIWLKSKKLSPAANAFLEYIKTNKTRLAASQFGWLDTYK